MTVFLVLFLDGVKNVKTSSGTKLSNTNFLLTYYSFNGTYSSAMQHCWTQQSVNDEVERMQDTVMDVPAVTEENCRNRQDG